MKPTPNPEASRSESPPVLVLGAHPDDIEFACGALIAKETRSGRSAHFVVCSLGESASHGTPGERKSEAEAAAAILGATIEFIEFDGDAHLELRSSHAIALAKIVRRVRPRTVLAPTVVENQHPDHSRLGKLARDAVRLARYGGVEQLKSLPSHAIGQLFYYAVTVEAEPRDGMPIFVDVSEPSIIAQWTAAMEAHASQLSQRNYIELQLARARLNGLRAGIGHAIALYPNDPLIVDSLNAATRTARHF